MDGVSVSFILYGLLPLTLVGLIYFWNIQKKHNRILFEFSQYRSELYYIQTPVQYFDVYRKVMEWSSRLSTSRAHELLRIQLFELVKERKDDLGIKKNIRMIN